jgi:hypothetical protein
MCVIGTGSIVKKMFQLAQLWSGRIIIRCSLVLVVIPSPNPEWGGAQDMKLGAKTALSQSRMAEISNT